MYTCLVQLYIRWVWKATNVRKGLVILKLYFCSSQWARLVCIAASKLHGI